MNLMSAKIDKTQKWIAEKKVTNNVWLEYSGLINAIEIAVSFWIAA